MFAHYKRNVRNNFKVTGVCLHCEYGVISTQKEKCEKELNNGD